MLSRYLNEQIGPLILRLSLGPIMLISHGLPKLTNYSSLKSSFPDPLGVTSQLSLALVIFSEVICSILLILGIKTRLFTIPLIITMAVAAFIIHAGDPWQKQEFPIIYLAGYISLLFTGGGKFSIKE